jgi:hypothetical protein
MGPSLEQWESEGESFDGGTNPNYAYGNDGGSEAKGGQDDGLRVTKKQEKPPIFKKGEAEGEPPA